MGLAFRVLELIMLGTILIRFYHNTLKKKGLFINHLVLILPKKNGLVERKNRHLLETTRALLFQHQVSKNYWGEAVLTSTYLINRIPSRVIDFKSPLNYLS